MKKLVIFFEKCVIFADCVIFFIEKCVIFVDCVIISTESVIVSGNIKLCHFNTKCVSLAAQNRTLLISSCWKQNTVLSVARCSIIMRNVA